MVADLLDRFNIVAKKDLFPNQLSGGQQQLVAIARAIIGRPSLLLADEPTGALDYATGKNILKLLQNTCWENKKTIVIITHNSAFEEMGNRVIRINNGVVSDIKINQNPIPAERIEW